MPHNETHCTDEVRQQTELIFAFYNYEEWLYNSRKRDRLGSQDSAVTWCG